MEWSMSVIKSFNQRELDSLKDVSDFDYLVGVLHNKGYTINELPDFASGLVCSFKYIPAVALFEGSFKIPDEELENPQYLHQRNHVLYAYAVNNIAHNRFCDEEKIRQIYRNPKLKDFGIPFNRIKFRFDFDKGFYIPDSDYNLENQEHRSGSKEYAREKTFSFLQFLISDKPHTSGDCPYLKLIGC